MQKLFLIAASLLGVALVISAQAPAGAAQGPAPAGPDAVAANLVTTVCASCHSLDHEWALSSGTARLLSWVVVYPPVLPAWKERTPFVVVLVESDEGCRTMGNLLGATADDLRMDMPMRVDFTRSAVSIEDVNRMRVMLKQMMRGR